MNKTKKKNRKKVDTVKSVNNSIRTSVRKLNPILKSIVGKKVDVAMRDLQFSAKRISKDIRKKIVMKRFRPRAKGRAAPILKPWSTVTIILSEVKQMASHGTKG